MTKESLRASIEEYFGKIPDQRVVTRSSHKLVDIHNCDRDFSNTVLIPRVNTQWMNVVLKTFATEAGADQDLIVLLVQDRAGWHRSQKVNLPARIETEFLPAYSPECDASHLTFAEQRHETRMRPRLPNDYGH